MLMHAIVHGSVRTHVRESALKVDSERKIPCRTGESNLRQRRDGPMLYQLSYIEDAKDTGTNSGKSGTRNLEADSIRGRAESTGRGVKLKTVKTQREDGAVNVIETLVAENVYLGLNPLWDWKPVERFKED